MPTSRALQPAAPPDDPIRRLNTKLNIVIIVAATFFVLLYLFAFDNYKKIRTQASTEHIDSLRVDLRMRAQEHEAIIGLLLEQHKPCPCDSLAGEVRRQGP
jgi:hypothetical protein